MTVHVLKSDEVYWLDVQAGKKPFEVRKDDRKPPYETGDLVVMVNAGAGPLYGGVLLHRIGYLARGGRIPEGWCVFELLAPRKDDDARAEMAMQKTEVSK